MAESDPEISDVSSSEEENGSDGDFEPESKPVSMKKDKSLKKRASSNGGSAKKKKIKVEKKKRKLKVEDLDGDVPLGALAKRKKTASGSAKVKTEEKTLVKEVPHLKLLEFAMQAHKWWEDEPQTGTNRWRTLEHNGVMFPPPYKPHGVKLLHKGKPVDLTPEQEEVATLYAEMPLDGPQLGDEKTAKVFNKNFMHDFREVLGKGHEIKHLADLDFSLIRAHVQKYREERKNRTKEEKAAEKAANDKKRIQYAYALVDGNLQRVGNVMVEPPGLFRGRGEHPKTGKLKKRVQPEQVTINIGADSPVPLCPIPGHSWGKIVHKQDVTWLANWNEDIMGGCKYVWLAASSGFKGAADVEKYEKARRLKNRIKIIRAEYERLLSSSNQEKAQLGTAMWVIDRLALRVGNEKDEDEADTVGCCSLRREHVLVDDAKQSITLDFLGKDSMRHFQEYKVVEQYGDVGKKVLSNFAKFVKGKRPDQELFDKLEVSTLNDHLKTLMPGLSAKVFRTMNASITLQQTLPDNIDPLASDQEKVALYNDANRKVAILCNHQRTVSNKAQAGINKHAEYIELLKEQLTELRDMKRRRVKDKAIKLCPSLKEDATADEKKKVAHLFKKQPRAADVEKRIETWKQRIANQEVTFQMKDDNKSVALGTSKINYMDPRISVAFAKKFEMPIEKIFATALRDKFPWAMSVDPSFVW